MQSGLWSEEGPVPLVSVQVQGSIKDFLCEVNVKQRYVHKGTKPIQTTFKFPLDLFGALVGFSATIDGKTIEAKVKARSSLSSQSENSLSNSASSLKNNKEDGVEEEEEEDQPNLFVCSIELLPEKEIEFHVRFASELVVEYGSSLRFLLPSSVLCPNNNFWEEAKESSSSPLSTPHSLNLDLSVEFPLDFSLESPSHKESVVIKKNQIAESPKIGQKHTAYVSLEKKDSNKVEPTFVLLFNMKAPPQPWSAISTTSSGSAILLSFFPQFNSKQIGPCEVIFFIDSMAAPLMDNVKSALLLFLRSLTVGVHFNIIQAGSSMSPSSLEYNQISLETATRFVQNMEAKSGNTDLLNPLTQVLTTPHIKEAPRQLFIITDGQASNPTAIFSLIRKHALKTRVFSFGVGDHVSHNLVTGMARAGYGESEFVADGEQLQDKLMRQLKRALQPALSNPRIQWDKVNGVVQAPEHLHTIFNGDRLIVYALLPGIILLSADATATLKAESADGQEVSFTAKLGNSSQGSKLIPILAARSRIRDLEEKEESPKGREDILSLAMEYGLASKYTSFIATLKEESRLDLHSSMVIPSDITEELGDKLSKLSASQNDLKTPPSTPNRTNTTPPVSSGFTTPPRASPSTSGSTTPLNANSAVFVPRSATVSPVRDATVPSTAATPTTSIASVPTSVPSTAVTPTKSTVSSEPPKTLPAESNNIPSTSSPQPQPASNNSSTTSTTSASSPSTAPIVPTPAPSASTPAQPPAVAAAVMSITSPKKQYTPEFILSFRHEYTSFPTNVSLDVMAEIFVAPGSQQKIDVNRNILKNSGNTVSTKRDTKSSSAGGHKRNQSGGSGARAALSSSRGGRASLTASKESLLPPVAPLVQSENRWQRPTGEEGDMEVFLKKSLLILNKMTLEMFLPLSDQLVELGINTYERMHGFTELIFNKAAMEQHFATMYATLCALLTEKIEPVISVEPETEKTTKYEFKRMLINICQTEFQNKEKFMVLDESLKGEEREEAELISKKRALGIVKFVGEIYKVGILAEKTIHQCITSLLEEINSSSSEEDLESLCKFITTTGAQLEGPNSKMRDEVKTYFARLSELATDQKLPSRIRFMIKDLIDMRDNDWTPRRKENEAKTLAEAIAEVEEINAPSTPHGKGSKNTSTTTPTSTGKGRRDKLTKSTSAIPRSQSVETADEWETAGSGRKGKGKGGREQLAASQGAWETVGGSGGKGARGKGGRGGTPGRYGRGGLAQSRDDVAQKREKDLAPVRANLFAALEDEESTSSSPIQRKENRSVGKSNSSEGVTSNTNAPPVEKVKKGVTIQEPPKQRTLAMIEDKLDLLLEEYLTSGDKDEALQCLEELELGSDASEAVKRAFMIAIEKKEKDREDLINLTKQFLNDDALTSDDFIDGFTAICETIEDLDIDNPHASKHLGAFIGHIVATDSVSLFFLKKALSPLVESGKAIQIAIVVLQTVKNIKGQESLVGMYTKSGLDLNRLLKKSYRDGDYLSSLLKEKGLESLSGSSTPVMNREEEDAAEEQKMTRMRRMSVSSATVGQISLFQHAEGYWTLDQRFADLLNSRRGDLEDSIPENIANLDNRTDIWATQLAVLYLEHNHKQKKESWGLLVNKALEWLDLQLKSNKISKSELQEDAIQCLKDLSLWNGLTQ
eukprot:TRINITY_DN759_c0_g2_i1.p1 TRINITY_DN759_c0_g2~~TRINITY_DN759_c0_g2_i1.p1  ORF type:complete len:1661 (-),score=652.84 TRINITY_DN759_c0_g2_i1:41-5023(-)